MGRNETVFFFSSCASSSLEHRSSTMPTLHRMRFLAIISALANFSQAFLSPYQLLFCKSGTVHQELFLYHQTDSTPSPCVLYCLHLCAGCGQSKTISAFWSEFLLVQFRLFGAVQICKSNSEPWQFGAAKRSCSVSTNCAWINVNSRKWSNCACKHIAVYIPRRSNSITCMNTEIKLTMSRMIPMRTATWHVLIRRHKRKCKILIY